MSDRDLEGWTIAFDLDGTLVDSAPDLIGTLNRMLAQYELPPVPMSSTRHLVGHGAMAMLRHGFMEAGAAWDEAHAPGLFDRFIEQGSEVVAERDELLVADLADAEVAGDAGGLQGLQGAGAAHAVDVGKGDFDPLFAGQIDACETSHIGGSPCTVRRS